MRKLILAAVVLIAAGAEAQGMEFEARKSADGTRYIAGTGDIAFGDGVKFRQIVSNDHDGEWLVLSSDGGSLMDGLEIGRAARRAGMGTMVPPRAKCLSACFFAFVGGVERHVAQTASLGSHQFYTGGKENGATATAGAQSISGAILSYLIQVGIDPEALSLIMTTPADDMFVFTPPMLEKYHLVNDKKRKTPDGNVNVIVVPPGPKREGCPWPDGFIAEDPLKLYPECR